MVISILAHAEFKRFSPLSSMAESSNYDYLFKVTLLLLFEYTVVDLAVQVVLIGDSGVGKRYASLFPCSQ